MAQRTSGFTWLVLIAIVIGVWAWIDSSSREEERAAAAAARAAALTPAQKKAEEAARVAAEAEQRKEQASLARASAGAKLLKKSANNPDSFKLETALVIEKTGAVCYEYRAANAFNAIMRGRAVLASDGKRLVNNEDDGFSAMWNAECAGKRGYNYASSIRWSAL